MKWIDKISKSTVIAYDFTLICTADHLRKATTDHKAGGCIIVFICVVCNLERRIQWLYIHHNSGYMISIISVMRIYRHKTDKACMQHKHLLCSSFIMWQMVNM